MAKRSPFSTGHSSSCLWPGSWCIRMSVRHGSVLRVTMPSMLAVWPSASFLALAAAAGSASPSRQMRIIVIFMSEIPVDDAVVEDRGTVWIVRQDLPDLRLDGSGKLIRGSLLPVQHT